MWINQTAEMPVRAGGPFQRVPAFAPDEPYVAPTVSTASNLGTDATGATVVTSVTLSGFAAPNTTLSVVVTDSNGVATTITVTTDSSGQYSTTLSAADFGAGSYSVVVFDPASGALYPNSLVVSFVLGTATSAAADNALDAGLDTGLDTGLGDGLNTGLDTGLGGDAGRLGRCRWWQ